MKKVSSKHDLNSALIGMILFDGSMLKDNMLYLRHGGKQLPYVDEKVEFISNYITPRSLRSSVDKQGYAYRYAYYRDDSLKYLYKKIYINGKKRLTKTILNRFDEITLAIMYMDDGCLGLRKDKNHEGVYKTREIHLNVQGFHEGEVIMLQKHILRKWDVDFHLTTDKGHPRLWCNTKNTIKFLEIVAPIIREFPTMHYKLDLKYKVKNISFL